MNAENFSQFLTNPSQLHQISYQELKSLVLQYPYAPSLRYLLMRKAKMDGHEDFEKLLNLASMYSFDRAELFQKMKNLEQEVVVEDNYLINEDYLELKDLAVLEEEFATEPIVETNQELAFSLDEIIESEKKQKTDFSPPRIEEEDNMAEEGLGKSLLERILNNDIEHRTQQEAVNNADLKNLTESVEEDSFERKEEEQIIEESIEIMQNEAVVDSGFELLESSPEKWLAATVKEIEEEKEKERSIEPESKDLVSKEIGEEEVVAVEQEPIDTLELKNLEEEKLEERHSEKDTSKEDTKKPSLEITNEHFFESKEADSKFINPQPKGAFNSWLKQYPHRHLGRKLDDAEDLPGKKKKKQKKKAQKIKEKEILGVAKASVIRDEEIATETLAFLLEKQGHHQKAIKMYEQLSLRMPEKSSFFAAKIENLKNNIVD